MKYDWMDAYVLKKRGVTKIFSRSGTGFVTMWVGKCLRPSVLDQKKNPYYITLKLILKSV